MVNTNKIRGKIVEMGYTQQDVAEMLGITPKTFSRKLNTGVFGTDEATLLIDILKLENPAEIFFGKK